MNRRQMVNIIYEEFRAEFGDDFPAHELLKSAARFVELIRGNEPIKGAKLQSPRYTFEERPVDDAMADGGWRVLCREASWMNRVNGDDNPSFADRAKMKEYGMRLVA
jgi:hypothetical protein